MKAHVLVLAACLALSILHASAVTTHYVNVNGTNSVAPYTNWLTAATNIQDAIVQSSSGDTVLVTNGIYQFGGDSFNGSNRVDVFNHVNVQSVNGPLATTIVGYQVPGTTNGASAVRCAYVRDLSTLSGFTLTNGATQSSGSGTPNAGGGVVTESHCVVSNCIVTGNAAYYSGGGVYSINSSSAGTVLNCLVSRNVATFGGQGGGAYGCILVSCVVSNNNSSSGAGLYNGLATNCLFVGNGNTNTIGGEGGATYLGVLNNCTIVGNFSYGRGVCDSSYLANCIIYDNNANGYADCYQCRITNCCTALLANNGIPVNCITNVPGFVDSAGGNYRLQIGSPCINTGTNAAVSSASDLDGNTRIIGGTVDMGAYENQFIGAVHYVDLNCTNSISPFTNWLTAATNIQDAIASAQSGEVVVANDGVYTNGGAVMFGAETNRVMLTNGITLLSLNGASAAMIVGGTQMRCVYVGSNSVLFGFTLTNGHAGNSGDITNEQSGGGAWCETGGVISNCWVLGNVEQSSTGAGGGVYGGAIYNSTLAKNTGNGGGAAYSTLFNCNIASNSITGTINGGGVYYSVASNCVFTANIGYSAGGGAYRSRLYNCTLFTNWSQFNGGAAFQCALYSCALYTNACGFGVGGAFQSFLTNCVLIGNHGMNGGTVSSTNYNCLFAGNYGNSGGNGGGGVNGGISYNCIFTNNTTPNVGGGAAGATLYNCLLVGNAAYNGGGAASCILNNCTVVGNTATNIGGGAYATSGSVNNSIVYYNHTAGGTDVNYFGVKFNFSCSFPSTSGIVTTNPPLFVDSNSDFQLLSNSPCINSGTNFNATNGIPFVAVDLDGNARIARGAVDIGAYEFQTPASVLPYWWLWQYGLATDGSADFADGDGDGMNDYNEWRTGTNPTNSASVLVLQSPTATATNATITWQSISGIRYFVQRGSDLSAQPAFSTIATNIVGQVGMTSYNDITATNSVPYFYRVGVQ